MPNTSSVVQRTDPSEPVCLCTVALYLYRYTVSFFVLLLHPYAALAATCMYNTFTHVAISSPQPQLNQYASLMWSMHISHVLDPCIGLCLLVEDGMNCTLSSLSAGVSNDTIFLPAYFSGLRATSGPFLDY